MCRKDRETRVVVLTGSGKAFVQAVISVISKFAGSDPSEPVRALLDPAPDCAGDKTNAEAGAGGDQWCGQRCGHVAGLCLRPASLFTSPF